LDTHPEARVESRIICIRHGGGFDDLDSMMLYKFDSSYKVFFGHKNGKDKIQLFCDLKKNVVYLNTEYYDYLQPGENKIEIT
jgi:hypothetical protein